VPVEGDLDNLPPDEDFDDWYDSTPFSADELKSQQICNLLALPSSKATLLHIYDLLQKSGDLRMPDAARKDSILIDDVESQQLCKRNGIFTKQKGFYVEVKKNPSPGEPLTQVIRGSGMSCNMQQRNTYPCKSGSQYERVAVMEWNSITEGTMNEIRDLMVQFLREAFDHSDVHPFVKKFLGLYLNDGLDRLGLTQKLMMQWLECAMQEGFNHHLGLNLPIRGEGFDFTRTVALLERLKNGVDTLTEDLRNDDHLKVLLHVMSFLGEDDVRSQVQYLSSWCPHPHKDGVDNNWTPDALDYMLVGRAEKGRDWDDAFEEPCAAGSSNDRWCDNFNSEEKHKSQATTMTFVSTKL
jgi:hypothetical protein